MKKLEKYVCVQGTEGMMVRFLRSGSWKVVVVIAIVIVIVIVNRIYRIYMGTRL